MNLVPAEKSSLPVQGSTPTADIVCPYLTASRLKEQEDKTLRIQDTSGLHLYRVRPSHSFTPSPPVAGKNAPYEAHSCAKDCQTSKAFLHPALARSTQAESLYI